MNNLFDYYRQMEKEDILLFFKGLMSDKILVGITEDLWKTLGRRDEKQEIIKKNRSVLVELAQNIYVHSADKTGKGVILIKDNRDYYEIIAGNLIENPKIHSLVTHVNHINQMDKNELKKFYCNKLKAPKISENAGGNIGLLVIARKTACPITLVVHLINEKQSLVEFFVKIKKGGINNEKSDIGTHGKNTASTF